MWTALAAMALAWSVSAPVFPLESRVITAPPFVIADRSLVNFDLADTREEARLPPPKSDETTRTIFRLRHHVGIASGYDQGVLHGSIGFYITVAEMGRWNLGVSSPGIGLSRYHVSDPFRGSYAKTDLSLLISLASVHYRAGYLQSLHKNWYVNFEQIFDSRSNVGGSQIGLSFSN